MPPAGAPYERKLVDRKFLGTTHGQIGCTTCHGGNAAASDPAAALRLRRIEGQIQGLQRMLDADRECTEIIQQFAAVRAALDRVAVDLISAGLEQCLRQELEGKPQGRRTLHKLQRTFLILR